MAKGARRKRDRARIASLGRGLEKTSTAGVIQAVPFVEAAQAALYAGVETEAKTAEKGDETSAGQAQRDSTAQIGDLSTISRLASTLIPFNSSPISASSAVRQDVTDPEDKSHVYESKPAVNSRPKASMRPRRPGQLKALDLPTSGFSAESTLGNASLEEKAKFAEMFSDSIDKESQEMRNPDKEVKITDEDAREELSYSSLVQIKTVPSEVSEEARSLSSLQAFSIDKMLQAVEDVSMSQDTVGCVSATSKTIGKPPRYSKLRKKDPVFIKPSANPRWSELASAQAPSALMPLDDSFPDEDNTFYHPQMTLQLAAQQVVKNFRAADSFLAHYCDDQKVAHTSTLKPVVVTQMENMTRDMRWTAQFLSLGKLGWDLVTLPHQFFDDVKALIPGLRRHLEVLSGRKGLGFLADVLEEVDRIEKALWMLQGGRREMEKLARMKWEKEKIQELTRGRESEHMNDDEVLEDEKAGDEDEL